MGWIEDVLQGASNAAAGTVSGPVDMLAWGLRKAGVHVGDAPVGGSEWMQRVGLTARPQNQWAGLAGESLGLLSPIFIQAYAPQIARGLLSAPGLLDSMATPSYEALGPWAQKGAIVYHGSPHKFDAFDSSKIGTGEGAQAYGHGLYFADTENTAKSYAENVLNMPKITEINTKLSKLAKVMEADSAGEYGKFKSDIGRAAKAEYDALMNEKLAKNQGALYKVDLPDSAIAKMLDWDKPLSQQAPEVQKAWQATKKMLPPNAMDDLGGNLSLLYGKDVTPEDFLGTAHSLGTNLGEAMLRRAGVPGIKYLDQGSRAAGQGTYNYVVFPGEESALKILERNGVPLGDAPNPYIASR